MLKALFVITTLFAIVIFSSCKWPCCCCNHTKEKAVTEQAITPQSTKQKATDASTTIAVASIEQFEKEVIKSDKPVVVDFSAEWCHACKSSKPVFDEVAAKLAATYKFVTINVDQANDLAEKYNIKGIPTFIFFNNGQEQQRTVGAITREDLTTTLEKTFGK